MSMDTQTWEINENLPADPYIHRERQRDRYIQTLAQQSGGEGSFSKQYWGQPYRLLHPTCTKIHTCDIALNINGKHFQKIEKYLYNIGVSRVLNRILLLKVLTTKKCW